VVVVGGGEEEIAGFNITEPEGVIHFIFNIIYMHEETNTAKGVPVTVILALSLYLSHHYARRSRSLEELLRATSIRRPRFINTHILIIHMQPIILYIVYIYIYLSVEFCILIRVLGGFKLLCGTPPPPDEFMFRLFMTHIAQTGQPFRTRFQPLNSRGRRRTDVRPHKSCGN